MNKIFNTIILCLACFCCQAQLYDAKWAIGSLPITILDFTVDSLKLDSISRPSLSFLTNASTCDENGSFLYYTNGIAIYGNNGDTLQNGTGLNPCSFTTQWAALGLDIQQAALFIPQPGNTRYYYLFHFSDDDSINGGPKTLYYSLIDKQGNTGLGSVIEKNVPIMQNTLLRQGGITSCKHANGRDYWLTIGAYIVNKFYTFLVTPNGVEGPFLQSIGPQFPPPYDNAYSRFSQDGSKFVTGVIEGPILVMDFDRCSGEFSNPITIYNQSCPNAPSCSGSASVEFSPNNRFVYVSDVIWLTQYDLWASNIQDSVQIAIDSTQFERLNMLQLAPNGKIYLSSWAGLQTIDSIHVINNPDAKGDSCNFRYAYQPTYTHNAIGMPNSINYRLGPLAGSGCDTITAINNVQAVDDNPVRVYPNPAKNIISLVYNPPATGTVEFDLIDELGNKVIQQSLSNGQNFAQFNTGMLSNGLYYWVLKDSNRIIKTGKVAIIK